MGIQVKRRGPDRGLEGVRRGLRGGHTLPTLKQVEQILAHRQDLLRSVSPHYAHDRESAILDLVHNVAEEVFKTVHPHISDRPPPDQVRFSCFQSVLVSLTV
jgi:hypothetical protein